MARRSTDQRRRRVVMDGARKPVDSASKAGGGSLAQRESGRGRSRGYSQAAVRQTQFRTADLIPKQFVTFGWITLALLICMAALNLLANVSIEIDPVSLEPHYNRLSSFSMAGTQGLTAWFSSFLLILTSLASLQVYALRQHRCNDYRGTYRVWLWFAAFLLLASVNCIVDLELAGRQIAQYFQLNANNGGSAFSIYFKLSCLALLVVRGIIEVRSSPTSIALVAVVWLAYSLAIAIQIPGAEERIVFERDPTYGNSLLFGSIALVLCVCTYARFVWMQSLGLIAVAKVANKTTKEKAAKGKTSKTKSKTKTKTDVLEEAETEIESDEEQSDEESNDSEEQNESRAVSTQSNAMLNKTNSAAPQVTKTSTVSPSGTGRAAPASVSQPGPLQAKMNLNSSNQSADDEDEDEEMDSENGRPLSKAERRKLRKAQSQQRRAA